MIDAQDAGYVTVSEAATRLHVSHPTIWRWIKAGRLRAYRVGPKHIRIKEADLAAVIQPAARRMEVAPLTEEERQRGLAVFAELKNFRQQVHQRRHGQPFSPSVQIIHETREERTRQLDQL